MATKQDKNPKPETAPPDTAAAGDIAPETLAQQLRLAFGFLTRIPVGGGHGAGSGSLAAAGWAFPVVGATVGAVGGAIVLLTAGSGLHPLGGALFALAVMAVVTGALHEDGLADFADGLGALDREKRLAIMADSRIGAFGVLALIFIVGLKASALMSLAGPGIACLTMIAAAGFSRAGMVVSLHLLPPAKEDGLGQGAGRPSPATAGAALAIGLLALAPLAWVNGGDAIAVAAAGFAAALFMGWALHTALGGQTGDGLGAQQQLTETAIYMAAAGAEVIL